MNSDLNLSSISQRNLDKSFSSQTGEEPQTSILEGRTLSVNPPQLSDSIEKTMDSTDELFLNGPPFDDLTNLEDHTIYLITPDDLNELSSLFESSLEDIFEEAAEAAEETAEGESEAVQGKSETVQGNIVERESVKNQNVVSNQETKILNLLIERIESRPNSDRLYLKDQKISLGHILHELKNIRGKESITPHDLELVQRYIKTIQQAFESNEVLFREDNGEFRPLTDEEAKEWKEHFHFAFASYNDNLNLINQQRQLDAQNKIEIERHLRGDSIPKGAEQTTHHVARAHKSEEKVERAKTIRCSQHVKFFIMELILNNIKFKRREEDKERKIKELFLLILNKEILTCEIKHQILKEFILKNAILTEAFKERFSEEGIIPLLVVVTKKTFDSLNQQKSFEKSLLPLRGIHRIKLKGTS